MLGRGHALEPDLEEAGGRQEGVAGESSIRGFTPTRKCQLFQ